MPPAEHAGMEVRSVAKTRYLVIARMAGNFAMVGESTDPTKTLEQVIKHGSEGQTTVSSSSGSGNDSAPAPVRTPGRGPRGHAGREFLCEPQGSSGRRELGVAPVGRSLSVDRDRR